MVGGVSINGIDIKSTLGLIVSSFSTPMPDAKTKYIDIPGADGSADLTEYFGDIKYSDREIEINFLCLENYNKRCAIQSEFARLFHGKKLKIIFDDDRGYYYIGRISLDSWDTVNGNWGKANVTIKCEPYKYEIQSSLEDWLWDPFSFEDGIIREIKNVSVDGTYTMTIIGRRMQVIPTIKTSAAMTVTFKGSTYDLAAGSNTIDDIVIVDGENTLVFTGTGTVSVDYRGGAL